jgi:U3 small nucleolar RNA-associated protein 10
MPSLREQLQSLQAPVSRSLGVEKERASLLFDRKEAASFSSEEFYNLGLSGLEQLRKVDRSLADYEEKLFDQSSIVLNRAILSKQENDELNESLERMIIYLSPYFNHQGCKQVLEWLIHKYHVS